MAVKKKINKKEKEKKSDLESIFKDIGAGVGYLEKKTSEMFEKLGKGFLSEKKSKSDGILYDISYEYGFLIRRLRDLSVKLEKEIMDGKNDCE